MSKISSKLAAGVRKVKGQDDKPAATQPEMAQATAPETETRRVTAPKAPPAATHPERVWPD